MNKAVIVFSTLSLISSFAFSRVDNFFIGNKGREVVSGVFLKEAPYKWVARISSDHMNCTGAVVGKELLLTASHCITKDDGELKEGIYTVKFPDQTRRSFTISKSQLPYWYHGEKSPDWRRPTLKDFKNDWAILKLDKPLPDDFGHFLLKSDEKLQFNQNNLSLAGYGRRTNLNILTTATECSMRSIKHGVIFHDCDSEKGDSGAPLFYQEENSFDRHQVNYYIAAVNAGEFLVNKVPDVYTPVEYSSDTSNVASSSSEIFETWNKLKDLKFNSENKIPVKKEEVQRTEEESIYGRFVKHFPSSVTGSICYLHCGTKKTVAVGFKVPKSLGPITNQSECTKRARDYCQK